MAIRPLYVIQIDRTGYVLSRHLPRQCMRECSAQGQVVDSVRYWVKRLDFDAPDDGMRDYLKACGLHIDETDTHLSLLERLLWVVAGDEKIMSDQSKEKRHLMGEAAC